MRPTRLSIVAHIWQGWVGALMFVFLIHSPVHAQRLEPEVGTLRAILSKPDVEIDLAWVKLTIDRMVDRSINVEANLRMLDAMAADVRRSAGANADSLRMGSTLRSYLYDAGNWNDRQAFRYDFDDPLGTKVVNKLLPNYLATRKGNCVSMPTLFVLLGQKLGMDVSFAASPGHFFVKYRDEAGRIYNVETVAGGHLRSDDSCEVSCDHIPRRSWALFRARDVMRGVIDSFKGEHVE